MVTKECDCMSKEKEGVIPDFGILASEDVLSLDKATVDLVSQANGRDIFSELFPETNYRHQFDYAQEMGLGDINYKIMPVNL